MSAELLLWLMLSIRSIIEFGNNREEHVKARHGF
jgi:hypothetical protein